MAKTLTDLGIQKIGRRFVDSIDHANYTWMTSSVMMSTTWSSHPMRS